MEVELDHAQLEVTHNVTYPEVCPPTCCRSHAVLPW